MPPVTEQPIAVGPVASQVAIKQLGTNGGGYYNVNSAHPLENPTPLSNFIEDLAILLIAGALCFTFGRMVGSRKQGVALLVAMGILLVPFVALTVQQEQQPNPALTSLARRSRSQRQHGRQGDPVRDLGLRAVGDDDDRRVERLRQLDARQLLAARRAVADLPDGARRGRRSAASAPGSTAC